MIQLMKTFWEGMGANRHYKLVLDNSTVVMHCSAILVMAFTGKYWEL